MNDIGVKSEEQKWVRFTDIAVSTKGQERDGNSLKEQEQAILNEYENAVIISESSSGAKV